ncbi:hypothetical protein DT87_08970 [Streptomyces sp. NTK 937]|nr:hypothetical protein DT87_08970 [Streptomyces sp. NTK 937]
MVAFRPVRSRSRPVVNWSRSSWSRRFAVVRVRKGYSAGSSASQRSAVRARKSSRLVAGETVRPGAMIWALTPVM